MRTRVFFFSSGFKEIPVRTNLSAATCGDMTSAVRTRWPIRNLPNKKLTQTDFSEYLHQAGVSQKLVYVNTESQTHVHVIYVYFSFTLFTHYLWPLHPSLTSSLNGLGRVTGPTALQARWTALINVFCQKYITPSHCRHYTVSTWFFNPAAGICSHSATRFTARSMADVTWSHPAHSPVHSRGVELSHTSPHGHGFHKLSVFVLFYFSLQLKLVKLMNGEKYQMHL